MTAATRSVFYGMGAWVGQQTSLTGAPCGAQDPSSPVPPFEQQKLIASDLARNPQAVRNGVIQPPAIEVDDAPLQGGATKVGPTWPTGSTWNSLWMEATK